MAPDTIVRAILSHPSVTNRRSLLCVVDVWGSMLHPRIRSPALIVNAMLISNPKQCLEDFSHPKAIVFFIAIIYSGMELREQPAASSVSMCLFAVTLSVRQDGYCSRAMTSSPRLNFTQGIQNGFDFTPWEKLGSRDVELLGTLLHSIQPLEQQVAELVNISCWI